MARGDGGSVTFVSTSRAFARRPGSRDKARRRPGDLDLERLGQGGLPCGKYLLPQVSGRCHNLEKPSSGRHLPMGNRSAGPSRMGPTCSAYRDEPLGRRERTRAIGHGTRRSAAWRFMDGPPGALSTGGLTWDLPTPLLTPLARRPQGRRGICRHSPWGLPTPRSAASAGFLRYPRGTCRHILLGI